MRIKNIIGVAVFIAIFATLSIMCITMPSPDYSESERRPLMQMPAVTAESVLSGEFSADFEKYASERIPLRDSWRKLKAYFATNVFGKKDNNGLFVADGHISKIDTEKNAYMMDYAEKKFKEIYKTYMQDRNNNVYLSIVPDKNMFLAEKNSYPSLDYKGFTEDMVKRLSFMKYIDIIPLLELDDYYSTDTHWKQENITDIAELLANEMGTSLSQSYNINTLDIPFYGVYSGQLAMDFSPDRITYLTNSVIDNAVVTYYDTGTARKGNMYSMKKAKGKDAYEMFLEGSMPLLTIENPLSKSDKHLIMFRDSFASSLAPLLTDGYKKITLVDIRYMQSSALGSFVDFENCDVLFMYSASLLNNSTALK